MMEKQSSRHTPCAVTSTPQVPGAEAADGTRSVPATYGLPEAQGLYDPAHEHDACGVGFVVNINGEKTHEIVRKGLEILINLSHRGACGCDPLTGDGAGILVQIPHAFFASQTAELGFTLPTAGEYGIAMCFL